MTIAQIRKKIVGITPRPYGHWIVSIKHRGKIITKITNNAPAIDRWLDTDLPERTRHQFYTCREAGLALLGK